MPTAFVARGPALVRGVQERAARALPAARVDRVGGWWLRHDASGAWWASSVLPHGDVVPEGLPRRIRVAEEFYAGHGTGARFQISPGACPTGLDHALAERGYRFTSPMSLLSAPAAHVVDRLPVGALPVRVDDELPDAWFETWLTVHGTGGDGRPEQDMLRRVDRPSAYASVVTSASVIAVGRAVADTGWTGIFSMATLPDARGKGAGARVLAALARWAADQDAARMYLQVGRDNAAARRLYERAGFAELCRYHYRMIGEEGPRGE